MVSLRDVEAGKFVSGLKEELKKVEDIKPPAWISYAKSGIHRERPPEQPDFWYIRAASILRRVSLNGPVGIARLKSYYGGRKTRGFKPQVSRRGGGSIPRKIFQQLERAGFIEKVKGGRKLTSKGQKFLDGVAYKVSKT